MLGPTIPITKWAMLLIMNVMVIDSDSFFEDEEVWKSIEAEEQKRRKTTPSSPAPTDCSQQGTQPHRYDFATPPWMRDPAMIALAEQLEAKLNNDDRRPVNEVPEAGEQKRRQTTGTRQTPTEPSPAPTDCSQQGTQPLRDDFATPPWLRDPAMIAMAQQLETENDSVARSLLDEFSDPKPAPQTLGTPAASPKSSDLPDESNAQSSQSPLYDGPFSPTSPRYTPTPPPPRPPSPLAKGRRAPKKAPTKAPTSTTRRDRPVVRPRRYEGSA